MLIARNSSASAVESFLDIMRDTTCSCKIVQTLILRQRKDLKTCMMSGVIIEVGTVHTSGD